MRLVVTSPLAVALDAENVGYVRAEDETGAFGVLPGHADFLTVVVPSVITWTDEHGAEHHLAVSHGTLEVRNGDLIEIATREAVGEESLARLGDAVVTQLRDEAEQEEESRVSATRLHLAAIRQVERYLEAGRRPTPSGGPPSSGYSGLPDSAPGEGEI
jgi:F-type H+-transporting ATPase subunit epsilon